MAYHPPTGFHYSKLLTNFYHYYGSFSKISGMYLGGSWYGQILICLSVKNILTMKIHVLDAWLHLAGCLFQCVSITDGML